MFQRILEPLPLQCKNCGDTGEVYVSFCDGGASKYATGGLATWYEGDQGARAGWYKLKKTVAYPCPKCAARPNTKQ